MNVNNEPDAPTWTVEQLRVELDRYEEELGTQDKPRNTITSYVYPVDRFLKWLDQPYSPIRAVVRRSPLAEHRQNLPPAVSTNRLPSPPLPYEGGSLQERRSRYNGLRTYLSQRSEPKVSLSFAQIDRIIGQPGLPKSARNHRAWWANERSGSHSHARSWLEANPRRRTANVDLNAETVDFVI
jgi:hypothetical protein